VRVRGGARKWSAGIAATTATALLAFSAPAFAEKFTVTKQGDPTPGACKKKDCSLREAVDASNNNPGKDEIVLPSRKRAYKLSIASTGEDLNANGDLDIFDDVSITHKSKGRATIDAKRVDRIFDVFTPASFSHLTLKGGKPKPDGPPIRPQRRQAIPTGGGAIRSTADITLRRDLLTANKAAGQEGAAIATYKQTAGTSPVLKLFTTTVSRNTGLSAVYARDDGLGLVGTSRITDNNATGMRAGGAFIIGNSTISNNKSSSIGGGLYLEAGAALQASTISGNSAGSGGGIFLGDGLLNVEDSTITGNRAKEEGGGIAIAFGDLSLNGTTLVDNTGGTDTTPNSVWTGGIGTGWATSVEVENSILSGNRQAGGPETDCTPAITSLGHNFVHKNGNCTAFTMLSDLAGKDPKLGKLRANGGPTKTLAVEKHSPVIGKASKTTAPERDQRGHKRDKHPDIGAFER
jgi:hypothetical protein